MANYRRKDLLNCKCGAKAILFKVTGQTRVVYCQKDCGQKRVFGEDADEAVREWNRRLLPRFAMDVKGCFIIYAKCETEAMKIFQESVSVDRMHPLEYEGEIQFLQES